MINQIRVPRKFKGSRVWVVFEGKVLEGDISFYRIDTGKVWVALYGHVPGRYKWQNYYNAVDHELGPEQVFRSEAEATEWLSQQDTPGLKAKKEVRKNAKD